MTPWPMQQHSSLRIERRSSAQICRPRDTAATDERAFSRRPLARRSIGALRTRPFCPAAGRQRRPASVTRTPRSQSTMQARRHAANEPSGSAASGDPQLPQGVGYRRRRVTANRSYTTEKVAKCCFDANAPEARRTRRNDADAAEGWRQEKPPPGAPRKAAEL